MSIADRGQLNDNTIQAFLQPDFDPADFLNSTLPSLSTASNARSGSFGRAVPLPELSTQLQTLLSQLNAQTSRLSSTLTQLTDEIVRSGSRLAYEVEVLKGETAGLTDLLDDGLRKDISLFTKDHVDQPEAIAEPEYLARLRTLATVRSSLDEVIKVFGLAMAWPLAPSETASLVSISAPESEVELRRREDKGRAYAEQLRAEVGDLIGSGNDVAGLEAAAARLKDLRLLAEVWKGTAEERARGRLLDSLSNQIFR